MAVSIFDLSKGTATGQPAVLVKCARLYPRCIECEEMVPLAESHSLGKRSKQRRCKACFNSRRSLQQWYAKMHRSQEWEQMDPEEKNKMIVENKSQGKGKGRRRQIKVEEKATCTDKIGLDQRAPFQTKKQLLGS